MSNQTVESLSVLANLDILDESGELMSKSYSRRRVDQIVEKTTKRYDGKHPSALFNINFELNNEDINEINKMIDLAQYLL